MTEEVLLKMALHAYEATGLKKLCMAGGVALNSVANGRILRETPFEEIYIQPAADDGSGALGAALYAYHAVLGKLRTFVMELASWGEEHSPGKIDEFLKEDGIRYQRFGQEEKLIEWVVDRLQQGRSSDGFREGLSGVPGGWAIEAFSRIRGGAR